MGQMYQSEKTFVDFLDSQGLEWEYEPRRFDLGDSIYTPDFYVPSQDVYYEVIGTQPSYIAHSKKKHFEKMSELFPNINLRIVYPDGQPYPPPIPKKNPGRESKIKDAFLVGVHLPQTLVAFIDRVAKDRSEGTRASVIRSVLTDWMTTFRILDQDGAEQEKPFREREGEVSEQRTEGKTNESS